MARTLAEAGVGSIAGFQVPIGIRKRKKKVDEMLGLNDTLGVAEAIAYFSGLDEDSSKVVEGMLDESDYASLAEMIRGGFAESALRAVIRNKVREIIRKKPGGAGYILYAPNPGRKKGPKNVGEFPTKLAARRAELNRYPPHEPKKLASMRKDVEKLRKHPEKAAETEREYQKGRKRGKKESLERLVQDITESIFREEKRGSDWDEYVDKLSKQAVLSDKAFQGMQKNIAKRSEKALKDASGTVKGALGSSGFEVKEKGVKKDVERGELYMEFYVGDSEGAGEVGPFYLVISNGYPKIDVSENARGTMGKLDPERSRVLRAEMVAVQEDALDASDDVAKAVARRDEYLMKVEKKVDGFVADLNALEISMLKFTLANKYRKIS